MVVFMELKHLLLEVLPSPTMVAQGRLLCIQNHLAMVCDSLWAINSMIEIPEMGVLFNYIWHRRFNSPLHVPVEFADWVTDVATAVIDVGELLSRIMDWEASLHFRHVILVELKEMLCDLNSLVLRGSAMGLPRDPMGSMNPLREDYSIVLKNEVVGRHEDLEKLIEIFQQQLVPSNNNGDDYNPFVIVIDGEERVGKTTLAHMIYHHTWVRQQFHHRIWVDLPPSVSTLEMIKIIGKEFAESINNEEYCDQKLHLELPLQAMWEYINEQLDGSRYLLVLHCLDLNSLISLPEWSELKNILLRVGGPGSAVLVILKSSTQSMSDMSFQNRVKDITTYCLKPLSDDAWLELFKRHAAMTIPPSKRDIVFKRISYAMPRFQLAGQTFGAKFWGSLGHNFQVENLFPYKIEDIPMVRDFPFAIIQLLQYHYLLDKDYNVILHMLTAEGLIPVEGLSPGWTEIYERFPYGRVSIFCFPRKVYLHRKVPGDSTSIPRCCRYLCLEINPRAIPFRRPIMLVEVSKKMIALILREDEATTQEDNAEMTFQVYKKRLMKPATTISLQVYKKRQTKAATAISKFLDKMSVRLVHLHILVVETSMIQSLSNEISKLVSLRYLHLSKLEIELLPKSLFDLPNLRILSLLHCKKLQKIRERIHKLKKLQILKLAYCTKLQQLPRSITRLKNLEELNMEGCCFLRKLPEDLVSFKSLRILNVAGCASLSQIPHGIEQSIGLRKLSGIFVGVNEGFVLTQFQVLTNLQEIRLQNLERAEEIQIEVLMGQQSLWDLSLHWGGEKKKESSESTTSVLKALRPSLQLKRLEIISYKGVEFPTWMSKQQLAGFNSLVEVRLINLKRCATLPSLGQLANLGKLEISGMDLITHLDDTFYGDGDIFPMLTELTFSEMLALEKWYMPKRKYIRYFSKLRQLSLIQCPKLKEINLFVYGTIRIWLNNETIWSVKFCSWDNLQNIEIIEIVGCQELRCLPQGMQSLNFLSKMTINSCNNLTTLVALDSLEELNIYACPVLAFNLAAFTKLRTLTIKGCPKMQIYHDAWKKKDEERW
ncbi:disease resistance protein RGA2-like isoform X2 [Zingiber officinale]|uniref:disease resistance protein RGA2-like isoform X2 n=1 Tax=Zingiber officinale TaxID=94328 RepID=UPI001C4A957D|nr:disease resistance protein RGA2-like isoform X2 [Zingiber officinale]